MLTDTLVFVGFGITTALIGIWLGFRRLNREEAEAVQPNLAQIGIVVGLLPPGFSRIVPKEPARFRSGECLHISSNGSHLATIRVELIEADSVILSCSVPE